MHALEVNFEPPSCHSSWSKTFLLSNSVNFSRSIILFSKMSSFSSGIITHFGISSRAENMSEPRDFHRTPSMASFCCLILFDGVVIWHFPKVFLSPVVGCSEPSISFTASSLMILGLMSSKSVCLYSSSVINFMPYTTSSEIMCGGAGGFGFIVSGGHGAKFLEGIKREIICTLFGAGYYYYCPSRRDNSKEWRKVWS